MIRVASVSVAAAIASLVVFWSNAPHAQSDNAGLVKERQDEMRSMGRSFGPLVAVLKGESTDMDAAAEAANTMNAAATKSADMFPEGTAVGEVEGSRAKPELWSQRAEFDAALDALIEATATLAATASAGNADAFGADFQNLAKACGGCHEGDGKAGGKFRVAKQ